MRKISLIAIVLASLAASAADASRVPNPPAKAPSTRPHSPTRRTVEAPPSSDLFSLRARRRFAAYLRMRLLEMREAGLARAADAVERGLPVEQLLAPER